MHAPQFRQKIESASSGHAVVAHNQIEISSRHSRQCMIDIRRGFDNVPFAFQNHLH